MKGTACGKKEAPVKAADRWNYDDAYKSDLLDTIARRLDVFISDLRLWCTLLSFGIMLEVDNRAFPVEEWNRALAYLSGRPCAFFLCPEAKNIPKP